VPFPSRRDAGVGAPEAAPLRARLLAARTPGEGWSYRSGDPSRVEPTAYALLALAVAGAAVPAEAVAWLVSAQNADGSWGGPATADAPWVSAPAILALNHLRTAPETRARGIKWLLESRSESPPRAEGVPTDTHIVGWSWTQGSFGWVEPTCHALIALRAAGLQHVRIGEAIRFLLDRRCAGGGWNYGVTRVLGAPVSPFPQTTALAVSALADSGVSRALDRDLDVLAGFLAEPLGAFDLASIALALDACDRDPAPALVRLGDVLDGGWTSEQSVHALALVALAAQLPGGTNPFGLQG
jgi:hypothetical protein